MTLLMAFLTTADASVFNESGSSVEPAWRVKEQKEMTKTNNKAIDFFMACDFDSKTLEAYLSYITPYLKHDLLWER